MTDSQRLDRSSDSECFADYIRQPAYDPSDFLDQDTQSFMMDSGGSFAERYVNGDSEVRVELKLRMRGIDPVIYSSFVYRTAAITSRPVKGNRFSAWLQRFQRRQPVRYSGDDGMHNPVFVDVVKHGQHFERVRSVVRVERLALLNREDCFLRSTGEVLAALAGPAALLTEDRELQLVVRKWLSALRDDELIDHVVESGPEIMGYLADSEPPIDRRVLVAEYLHRMYPGIFVMVMPEIHILVFDPRRCRGVQLLDLKVSPVEARSNGIEGTHAHG